MGAEKKMTFYTTYELFNINLANDPNSNISDLRCEMKFYKHFSHNRSFKNEDFLFQAVKIKQL